MQVISQEVLLPFESQYAGKCLYPGDIPLLIDSFDIDGVFSLAAHKYPVRCVQ